MSRFITKHPNTFVKYNGSTTNDEGHTTVKHGVSANVQGSAANVDGFATFRRRLRHGTYENAISTQPDIHCTSH